MKKILIAAFLAFSAASAFAGNSSSGIDADPSLIGRWQWISMKLIAVTVETGDKAEDYILEFKENGNLGVEADCRLGDGSYRTSGSTVLTMDLDAIDSTDCGLDSWADEMVDMLNEGSFEYSLIDNGDVLELKFAKGAGIAIFEKAE